MNDRPSVIIDDEIRRWITSLSTHLKAEYGIDTDFELEKPILDIYEDYLLIKGKEEIGLTDTVRGKQFTRIEKEATTLRKSLKQLEPELHHDILINIPNLRSKISIKDRVMLSMNAPRVEKTDLGPHDYNRNLFIQEMESFIRKNYLILLRLALRLLAKSTKIAKSKMNIHKPSVRESRDSFMKKVKKLYEEATGKKAGVSRRYGAKGLYIKYSPFLRFYDDIVSGLGLPQESYSTTEKRFLRS